ncbi:predicted protein [Naegleria gruberi]|uniref:threonine--tRNA ligase n=1 Tax=Naegleria gruberi TaxID=5762 RepID=D2VQZ7_NAEGR|nr:uncharacterized protein NAEGRDRAFT_51559 [Naegleria gruberi]EFC40723.1 predicted protein [Naegleria gruberi]|eukprot:XP_002673467.1 predicted protein [Naegleria gruberi strain NEG-M]
MDDYFSRRNKLFDQFKEKRRRELGNKIGKEITITIDKDVVKGKAFETSPYKIASDLSNDQSMDHLIAKINGKLWDMNRELEGDGRLEFCSDWNDLEVRRVFKRSSAFVLGAAVEQVFKCLVSGGAVLEDDYGKGGFFYENFMDEVVRNSSINDHSKIKKEIEKIIEEKHPFERLIVRKYEALELFAGNKFKIELLNEKFKDDDFLCVYRCGCFIDTSVGPHLLHTGQIASFEIISNTRFLSDTKREILRFYGISFPTVQLKEEWKIMTQKLKLCDHKKVGKDQELWFFHPHAPGMVSLLPHGKRICNSVQSQLREAYWRYGFAEVQSPIVLNKDLWYYQSGSRNQWWQQYNFALEIDKEYYILKPYNKPIHCIMYRNKSRSYRDLPIRYVEFGSVFPDNIKPFRLNGRLRSFQKDESTIFCQSDQTKKEVLNCLQMMGSVYNKFGFEFKIVFSTKPVSFYGDNLEWIKLEGILETALKSLGHEWERDEGGAPSLGPRIEFYVSDNLKRFIYLCGIIQMDLMTPRFFNLTYTSSDNSAESKPICISSTILNNTETFMALSAERYGGKWPFWLSPRQAIIIPICEKCSEYANNVKDRIHQAGYYVDVDMSFHTIEKKIRNAHLAQYNYILIIGVSEMETDCVNVRIRDGEQEGVKSIQELLEEFEVKIREFK